MNILILSHEYPPIGGGGANACYYLSKEFVRAGNKVTVLTAQFEDQEAGEITKDQVQIFRVACRRKKRETSSLLEMASYLVHAWRRAERMVCTGHFDICLVFFGVPSGPIAWHLKKRFQLPYVIRLGGGDIPGAQKRFKYLYKILEPIIRRIWKDASGLIANSAGLKKRAQRFEDAYKIEVFANGVDDQFFTPAEKKNQGTVVRILFVSRLIEGKGLQYVIPELKNVNDRVKKKCGSTVELLIVGDGPYRKQLEEIVCSTKCTEIVKFEGRKEKEQVRQYYQDADLFILPSLSEGMPNVVLEAMACGLPVLMTHCEGSRELIVDNGITSTLEGFSDQMVKLCTDMQLRTRMGENGLHRVRKQFQWEKIARKYTGMMQDILLRDN